jgi:organic hydroperoxide reductase OsmC/OhrA
MSEDAFQIRVRWTGGYTGDGAGPRGYTRDMLVEPASKPPIPGSSATRYGGDDSRYNPEDLMLASLAECHLLTYLALASREKIRIVSLNVEITGVLARVDGKTRFREATLFAQTLVERAEDKERATLLHDEAHAGCFMSNSVNFAITVRPDVSVETERATVL